jgi:MYXO-CTERM domain-containing protein
MKHFTTLIALFALAAPSLASAAQQPNHLIDRPEVEVPAGEAAPRLARSVTRVAPFLANAALSGGMLSAATWKTVWDRDTDVPLRIYGSGVSIPGSVADAAVAESAARQALADHIHLLAPGASADDFDLVSNHHGVDGIRTVGFRQRHHGIPVVGGQVSFRFKNDRLFVIGSEALPHVSIAAAAMPSDRELATIATDWIDADFGTASQVTEIGAAKILPLIRGRGLIDYHLAVPVTVRSASPVGKWTVYIGADRAPVARKQMLKFATGTVLYDVPVRRPGSDRNDLGAPGASVVVDDVSQNTGLDGSVSFDGASGQVVTSVVGPRVRVINNNTQNPTGSTTLSIADGGSAVWSEAGDEALDAQLTTFVYANLAKERLRVLNPELAWLDQQMEATVNINDTCNAFSDGDSINFFVSSLPGSQTQCGNTGQLTDVVYHEFGHSMHGQSIIPGAGAFDGAFSEGLSDYWAATITGDSGMGRGFFKTDEPLREIDPPGFEASWPQDVSQIPHTTGLIFAGAMWDLRKDLVATYGETEGAAISDRLFYAAVQRASDIPSTYIEILAADDDDGNLGNGTPNQCAIEAAFAPHGLAEGGANPLGPGLDLPVRDRYAVSVPIVEPVGDCPAPEVTGMDLSWRIRDESGSGGTVPMSLEASSFTGQIPPAADGAVVQYQVAVSFADGSTKRLPLNPAEPFYEFFNGNVEVLYCTDFETDPRLDWQSGSVFGSNDWEWGTPAGGLSSGDPFEAYSGTGVFGNDLSADGRYDANASSFARTPVVDTSTHDQIRLQYRRWLGIEDGFYDQARILANDVEVWSNVATDGDPNGLINHEDREWRFHDVDLTSQAASGSVQVEFNLQADGGAQFAGWNLDDVCVVGLIPSVCGDGNATGPEECDDGNTDNGDGCTDECLVGDGGGCGCQSADQGAGGLALLLLVGLVGYIRRNRHRLAA